MCHGSLTFSRYIAPCLMLFGCNFVNLELLIVCRAGNAPTLNDYDHSWSFKSGTENISVAVDPLQFIGQFLPGFCLIVF